MSKYRFNGIDSLGEEPSHFLKGVEVDRVDRVPRDYAGFNGIAYVPVDLWAEKIAAANPESIGGPNSPAEYVDVASNDWGMVEDIDGVSYFLLDVNIEVELDVVLEA